jgi:RNA polymerase sigma factor (sigma-70 family)
MPAPSLTSPVRSSRNRVERYARQVSDTDLTEGTDPLGQAFAEGRVELRSVYDEHAPLVYAICRKALGTDAAGEVTQDVFVSAWRGREQFDPRRGSLAAWLVGITKRRIVDHARREQRHAGHRADIAGDDPFASVPASDDKIDRIAQRVTLAHALATLPERPRQSISLAYVHGLTHDEIAERTGVPLGTIKSDIRRGLLALRRRMEPADEQ